MGAAHQRRRRAAAADDPRRRRCTASTIAPTSRARRSRARCCSPACIARAARRVVEPVPTGIIRSARSRRSARSVVRDGTDGVASTAASGCAAIDAAVPGDISSAVFWLVAGGRHAGSDLTIEDVGLNPIAHGGARRAAPRRRDIDVQAAADLPAGEPTGTIRVRHTGVHPFEITPAEVPGLIDEIPALAALAAMQPGGRHDRARRRRAARQGKRPHRMLARGFRALGVDGRGVRRRLHHAGGTAARRRAPTPPATIGWPWPSRSPAAAAPRPGRTSAAPAPSAVSYPGFFAELERLSRRDGRDAGTRRQDLSRGLHGGRQDDRRAAPRRGASAGAAKTWTS